MEDMLQAVGENLSEPVFQKISELVEQYGPKAVIQTTLNIAAGKWHGEADNLEAAVRLTKYILDDVSATIKSKNDELLFSSLHELDLMVNALWRLACATRRKEVV